MGLYKGVSNLDKCVLGLSLYTFELNTVWKKSMEVLAT